MNYVLQDIFVYKGKNSRGDYYWAQGSLFYEEDPYDNPSQLPIYPILNPIIVNQLRKVATVDPNDNSRAIVDIAKLQKAIDEKKFEDESECRFDLLHIKNVYPHDIKLNGVWARIARRPTTVELTNGSSRIIQPGQFLIGKNGTITPVTELRIYIKHNADGNAVENPNDVVNRILERRYKPLMDVEPTDVNRPSTPEAEATKSAEAAAEEAAQKAAEEAALGAAF